MEYVENAMNLVLEVLGVNLVMPKDLRKILKIGLVEIKMLMNSYNNHNLMLYILQNIWNGYLLKNFKMLLILPKVVLVKFIQLNGLDLLVVVGILKIKNGQDRINFLKLH